MWWMLISAAVAGPHGDHQRLADAGRLVVPHTARARVRSTTARPDVTVYGYWPYWGDDLDTVPMEHLTHLALFGVELAADGTLTDTSRWWDHVDQALTLAAPWDVSVHVTVMGFDPDLLHAVLSNPGRRATAVAELRVLVEDAGAQGVNVDFEGLRSADKAGFVAFIEELDAAVDELYLATPAVDWGGAYDYDALALASDGLFIMAYGYHWQGGDPGPITPLQGGGIWGERSLAWTIEDYQTWGAPADRLIAGLPLYGREWPTEDASVPGTATGQGEAVVWSETMDSEHDPGRLWDATTHTPFFLTDPTHQLWYDDAESIGDKIAHALDAGIQGIGFWALTYDNDDPLLWAVVEDLTTSPPDPADPADPTTPDTTPPAGFAPEVEKPGGCACSTRGGPSWALALFGGLALTRRRRGPPPTRCPDGSPRSGTA